jgi:hypothetical protein
VASLALILLAAASLGAADLRIISTNIIYAIQYPIIFDGNIEIQYQNFSRTESAAAAVE